MKMKINKLFLLFALTCFSYVVNAQSNAFVKGLYSYDGGTQDTIKLQNDRTATQNKFGNTGLIYFDKVRNKWRAWDGTTYVDLLSTGGSGTVTSVGLLAGTTGTDVNITGSPITGSGDITINIPDASSIARGLITIGSQTISGKKTFTPTATLSGLNVGSTTGFPSSFTNGDISYSTTNNALIIGISGTQGYSVWSTSGTIAADRIPHYFTTNGRLTSTAGFTFNGTTFTTPNVVSNGRGTFTTTSVLAGINVGGFAGDPSTITNGNFWYNTNDNSLGSHINGQIAKVMGLNSYPSEYLIPFATNTGIFNQNNNLKFSLLSNSLIIGDGGTTPININTNGSIAGPDDGLTIFVNTQTVGAGGDFTLQAGASSQAGQDGGDLNFLLGIPGAGGNKGKFIVETQEWNGDEFTPTITLINDITSATVLSFRYLKVGTTVHYSGVIEIDPDNLAVNAELEISLPFASNFSSVYDAVGIVNYLGGNTWLVNGDTTNDRIQFLSVAPSDFTAQSYYFSGSYTVK